MRVRRIVTGHDDRGRAIVVADDQVEGIAVALLPGVEFHRVWGADSPPRFPDAGAMPAATEYFPPIGGFRFGFFTLPPGESGGRENEVDFGAALNELESKLPGLVRYMEPNEPGMHTTPTVDIDLVISGEVVLELDEGKTVKLCAGDSVVQNGTRHRWRNDGPNPVTVAYFICGAHHTKF